MNREWTVYKLDIYSPAWTNFSDFFVYVCVNEVKTNVEQNLAEMKLKIKVFYLSSIS